MKKKIMALLLVMAVMMSMSMFMSCNGEEEEETDLGDYLENVNVTVRAVAGGNTLFQETFPMSGYAANLTVAAATRDAVALLDPEDIDVVLNDRGGIVRVGNYAEGDTGIPSYDEDDDYDYDEYGYDENGDEEATVTDGDGYFWDLTVGGREGSLTNTITDGTVIEWTFATLD